MFLYSNAFIATAWFRLSQSIFLHFTAFLILRFNCLFCLSQCFYAYLCFRMFVSVCGRLFLRFTVASTYGSDVSIFHCTIVLHCRHVVRVVQTGRLFLYLTRCRLYPWFRLWQTVFLYFTIGRLYPWFRLQQTVLLYFAIGRLKRT